MRLTPEGAAFADQSAEKFDAHGMPPATSRPTAGPRFNGFLIGVLGFGSRRV